MGNTQQRPIKCCKCNEKQATYRKEVSLSIVPCKCDLRNCKCYDHSFSNIAHRINDTVDKYYNCKKCGKSIYQSVKNCVCGWNEKCDRNKEWIKKTKSLDFYYGAHGNNNKRKDTSFKQYFYGCNTCIGGDKKGFEYNGEGYNTHHWYK